MSTSTAAEARQGAAPDPAGPRRGGPALGLDLRLGALLGVLVAICVVGWATSDLFLTGSNISTVLRAAAAIGVVSIGMTFVIIGGGIDLSVGSLVALCSVWMTTVATQSYGPFVMVLAAVLVGVGFGAVNGLLVSYGRVVPFIATLAMFVSARGLAERISGRRTQVVTQTGYSDFFRGDLLGIPVLVWMFAVVFAAGWVLLNRTTFGRRTLAVGGNEEAARLAGIDVKRHTVLLYALSGLCCAIGAMMVVARTTSGASTNGFGYELDAIAAVVIGGTLLSGGRGSLVGTVVGVLIFTVVRNVFTLNNLETDVQNIAQGVIIVAAVLIQARTGPRRRRTVART